MVPFLLMEQNRSFKNSRGSGFPVATPYPPETTGQTRTGLKGMQSSLQKHKVIAQKKLNKKMVPFLLMEQNRSWKKSRGREFPVATPYPPETAGQTRTGLKGMQSSLQYFCKD
ncbi:hypothetical protein CEXT_34051 [Caerostris extrusa]|uniref:Uncharacterized protein n=1 Tax=Caerostris extrusa TaxID=172846 RepID=A0AAV4PE33_CAEEX|nr:hypothetical protein CEXT_34051 [Caerostris extrusa]